jgi:hypothetical protein
MKKIQMCKKLISLNQQFQKIEMEMMEQRIFQIEGQLRDKIKEKNSNKGKIFKRLFHT